MTTCKNCTAIVKACLIEGELSYKAIAIKARKHFPDAKTTDKSVASIARDMRKAGIIEKREPIRTREVQLTLDL